MKQGLPETIPERQPRLLDQLRRCIRDKHYSLSTERIYVYWAKWYIRFHGLRHPANMGPNEIRTFLSYLNNDRWSGALRIAIPAQKALLIERP